MDKCLSITVGRLADKPASTGCNRGMKRTPASPTRSDAPRNALEGIQGVDFAPAATLPPDLDLSRFRDVLMWFLKRRRRDASTRPHLPGRPVRPAFMPNQPLRRTARLRRSEHTAGNGDPDSDALDRPHAPRSPWWISIFSLVRGKNEPADGGSRRSGFLEIRKHRRPSCSMHALATIWQQHWQRRPPAATMPAGPRIAATCSVL